MYEISNALKAQLVKHTRVEHVRGTIGGVSFTDSNVISMTYTNRASNTDDIGFGLAYIGQISATFYNVPIARKGWKNGKKIVIEWGVEILEDEEITIEWLPLGVFYISSAEWTDAGVNVTANDVISKLDKKFGGVQTNANNIYGFLGFACQQCGVEAGITEAAARALPNGTRSLKLAEKNDIKTWRDFVAWLASTAAGFVTATRDGKITIRSFADDSVIDSWGTGVRIAGSVFSDFDVEYAGVIVSLDEGNAEISYTARGVSDLLPYIPVGADPFIQDAPAAAQVMADVAGALDYTPFTTALLSNLVYDLGDVVECQNGTAGSDPLKCCIMSIDWTFKQLTTFKGFGADPDLSKGKSKTDKAITGAKSQTEGLQIQFVKYINSSDYEIEETEIEIADLQFALLTPTDVEEWGEIKLTATNPAALILNYYLDGELVGTYEPSEEWNEGDGLDIEADGTTLVITTISGGGALTGTHTVNFHYHLSEVSNNGYHHWKITATAPTGTVSIDTGDIHVILWAQGMAGADDWAGRLQPHDEIPLLMFNGLELFGTLADSASVTIGGTPAQTDYRTTPEGDFRITPNGDTRIIPAEV